MPDTRVQVILKTNDAIAENFVSNSFCTTGVDSQGTFAEQTVAFKAFYDAVRPYLGGQVAQNGHIIKFTDLPGFTPNYPFAETTFDLTTAPSGDPNASELAVCMSMQGSRSAGFPQARRRGRVYIGPLLASANSAGRPSSALITAVANAGGDLITDIAAITGDVELAVWSTVDGAAVVVDNGWVDNAWDVQRRRGIRPTSRTTF